MSKKTILLIEDDEGMVSLLTIYSKLFGYLLDVKKDPKEALRSFRKRDYDLVLLDIKLPKMDGFEVLKKIKGKVPVIMITAKREEIDELQALELGAEDYLKKPFSCKVLFSRIDRVLSRFGEKRRKNIIKFKNFVMDIDRYLLKKDKKMIPLTLSEFEILKRLIVGGGDILSREQLLDKLDIIDRNIDVHISALRKKLGPGFNNIETVRGIGYRFNKN